MKTINYHGSNDEQYERVKQEKIFADKKYLICKVGRQYAREIYDIEKFAPEWPADQELLNLCDPYHFGGFIKFKHDNRAMVVIYTD